MKQIIFSKSPTFFEFFKSYLDDQLTVYRPYFYIYVGLSSLCLIFGMKYLDDSFFNLIELIMYVLLFFSILNIIGAVRVYFTFYRGTNTVYSIGYAKIIKKDNHIKVLLSPSQLITINIFNLQDFNHNRNDKEFLIFIKYLSYIGQVTELEPTTDYRHLSLKYVDSESDLIDELEDRLRQLKDKQNKSWLNIIVKYPILLHIILIALLLIIFWYSYLSKI